MGFITVGVGNGNIFFQLFYMSRAIGIILAFFFYIHCSQSIKNSTTPAQPNEVKYVFAAAGLRLREAPDLNAKNLVTLPYGAEVEILRKTGIALFLDSYTSGIWVEAKWKDKTGYAFDGYLLDKKEFTQFDKVFQFVKRKILEKIKSYGLSSKLRIDEEKWNWSQIQFNQKKSYSNFTVYTLFPNKTTDGEGCNFYMSSTCINVILDDKDNIVFTDLDFEPMGQIYYIDEEIVRSGYGGGEGDNCSSGGTETSFVYIFKSKDFVKHEDTISSVCVDPTCTNSEPNFVCKKWKDFREEKYSIPEPSSKIKEYFKRTKESEKK